MIATLRRLFKHMQWADAAVLESLRSSETPARAIEIYGHLLASEYVWLSRLLGVSPVHAVWPALDLEGCSKLAWENNDAYGRFAASLEEIDLSREVTYTNSAGQTFQSRVDDILMHVALHGSYHRGQIALLVRDAGGVPPRTDYIAHVRGVPAATRVDSLAQQVALRIVT